MNEYDKQALDFLEKTNTNIIIKYLNTCKYFPDDKQERDVYAVSLYNNKCSYNFFFWDSIHNTEKNKNHISKVTPTAYDILAWFNIFDWTMLDFIQEYWYEYNANTIDIYNKVIEQNYSLKKLFTQEELDLLFEIN